MAYWTHLLCHAQSRGIFGCGLTREPGMIEPIGKGVQLDKRSLGSCLF